MNNRLETKVCVGPYLISVSKGTVCITAMDSVPSEMGKPKFKDAVGIIPGAGSRVYIVCSSGRKELAIREYNVYGNESVDVELAMATCTRLGMEEAGPYSCTRVHDGILYHSRDMSESQTMVPVPIGVGLKVRGLIGNLSTPTVVILEDGTVLSLTANGKLTFLFTTVNPYEDELAVHHYSKPTNDGDPGQIVQWWKSYHELTTLASKYYDNIVPSKKNIT